MKITGLVYYVLDATRLNLYLKIGYTTDLKGRVYALRDITASGQPPVVMAIEAGSLSVERQRHQEFGLLRSHGEWFCYDGDLRKAVAEMEHPASYLLDRPWLWRFSGGWGPLGANASRQIPGPASPAAEDPDEVEEQPTEYEGPGMPPVDF